MGTTRYKVIKFTEKEFEHLTNLIDTIEGMRGGYDSHLEDELDNGLKSFTKAINRSGIFIEDGVVFDNKNK